MWLKKFKDAFKRNRLAYATNEIGTWEYFTRERLMLYEFTLYVWKYVSSSGRVKNVLGMLSVLPLVWFGRFLMCVVQFDITMITFVRNWNHNRKKSK